MSACCLFEPFGDAGSCLFAGDDTDLAFSFALDFGDCFGAALGEREFGLLAFAFVAVGTGAAAPLLRAMAIKSKLLVQKKRQEAWKCLVSKPNASELYLFEF